MEQTKSGQKPRRHFSWTIAVLAIVALIAALCYIAYLKGAFRRTEKVALVTSNQNSFWDPLAIGANDAGRDFGVNVTFIKSEPDEASQAKHLKELIDGGINGLAVSPIDPAAEAGIINEAASKIPVVTFDSDAPNTNRLGFVGTDNYAAGQVDADEVRTVIPDGGKIILTLGNTAAVNVCDRRQGLLDSLLNRPADRKRASDPIAGDIKGDKYDVIATIVDGGDAEHLEPLVAAAIKANPDVKCIVGLNGYSGPAIVKAIEAAGKSGQIKVIGFDETPQEQALVASGAIYSSILQDQYRCGYETVRVLADKLHGVRDLLSSGPRLAGMTVQIMRPDNIAELRAAHTIRDVPAKAAM